MDLRMGFRMAGSWVVLGTGWGLMKRRVGVGEGAGLGGGLGEGGGKGQGGGWRTELGGRERRRVLVEGRKDGGTVEDGLRARK